MLLDCDNFRLLKISLVRKQDPLLLSLEHVKAIDEVLEHILLQAVHTTELNIIGRCIPVNGQSGLTLHSTIDTR